MSDLEQQPRVIDDEYFLDKYKSKIDYYCGASTANKKSYKRYRSWTIFLGSLVTLVSSISAAEFVQKPDGLRIAFAVATPHYCSNLDCY